MKISSNILSLKSSNKMRSQKMKKKKYKVRFIMIVLLFQKVTESMIYRTIHISCRRSLK
jgi:hypothetical protein